MHAVFALRPNEGRTRRWSPPCRPACDSRTSSWKNQSSPSSSSLKTGKKPNNLPAVPDELPRVPTCRFLAVQTIPHNFLESDQYFPFQASHFPSFMTFAAKPPPELAHYNSYTHFTRDNKALLTSSYPESNTLLTGFPLEHSSTRPQRDWTASSLVVTSDTCNLYSHGVSL